MSRPLRVEREGALWHVIDRGVERREIFRDRDDRATFLQFLSEAVTESRWRLHAYVLMHNHYHLLVETPERTLTQGAKHLNESYANHFNWRHDRVGHLFQGRFKSVAVERDGHLREMLRYIVLNPVRCRSVESAGDFEWSNYRATAGMVATPDWLEVDWTLAQFHEDRAIAREMYRDFVNDPGGADWRPPRVVRTAPDDGSLARIRDAVRRAFGETEQQLCSKNRGYGRKAIAQMARETDTVSFEEIARFLGSKRRAASQLAETGRLLEQTDETYRARIAMARAELNAKVGSDPSSGI